MERSKGKSILWSFAFVKAFSCLCRLHHWLRWWLPLFPARLVAAELRHEGSLVDAALSSLQLIWAGLVFCVLAACCHLHVCFPQSFQGHAASQMLSRMLVCSVGSSKRSLNVSFEISLVLPHVLPKHLEVSPCQCQPKDLLDVESLQLLLLTLNLWVAPTFGDGPGFVANRCSCPYCLFDSVLSPNKRKHGQNISL